MLRLALNRARAHSRMWRSRLQLTRKPNLWRLVSIVHHQPSVSHNLRKQVVGVTLFPPCSQSFSSGASSTGSIKARFENIAKQKEEEDRKRAEEERLRRQAKEQQEQEAARRQIEESAKAPSPVPAASPSPTPSPTPAAQPVRSYGVSRSDF